MLLNRYSTFLTNHFGCKVRRIAVDAGFTCPNRDGTLGTGGCSYCNNDAFSPAKTTGATPLTAQIDAGVVWARRRYPEAKGLVYFQTYSNTYAKTSRLRNLYKEALSHPEVVGLVIGTRPDCVGDEVVELLAELAATRYIQLEVGLQTASDQTLEKIGRGHTVDDYLDCINRCLGRGFDLCAHMIVGLPGEGRDEALRTAELIADSGVNGIKIHHLHIVKGSRLASEGAVTLDLPEYVSIVADIIERLPQHITVQKLWGSAPTELLVAPDWSNDGNRIMQVIEQELARRGTRQGSRY